MGHLDSSFWAPISIPPIPILAQLRDDVLRHSVKRMPKWKFRLDENLIVQLQPKPSIVDFEGLAYFGAHLTARAFMERDPKGVATLHFRIAAEPPIWWFQTRSAHYVIRDPVTHQYIPVDYVGNRARLLARLSTSTFANLPNVMLTSQCLMCGKGLTDPASMARFIGPECAGTSSLTVPRVLPLQEEHVS